MYTPLKQSFLVEILYQQNATWQGTVKWVNNGKTQNFRSALELLRLIDSTMEQEKPVDWEMVEERPDPEPQI